MMMHGSDDPFRGKEVPLEFEEHIAALSGWLKAHPEDAKAQRLLREALKAMDEAEASAPLPDWTWTEAEDPPPRKWLVQDWLPAGRVTLLAGRGGAGKSRIILQLTAGIASGGGEGDAWIDAPQDILRLGKAVPSAGVPVAYATWEDEEAEFARRLSEISGDEAPWVTPARLQNLHVVNLSRRGALWAPLAGRHVATLAELTDTGRLLRERAAALEARLLILDPLAAAYAGDENARGLVRAFVADWDGWAQDTGCAVLLVAHPPKNGADFSGSTDWAAAVRCMWTMKEEKVGDPPKGKGQDTRQTAWQLALPKRNYGPDQAPLRMAWDTGGGSLRWRLAWWEEPQRGGGRIDFTS